VDEFFENPILFENPVSEGGKIAIGVATVALIGAGLYFIFRPSLANAAAIPAGQGSSTPTAAPNRSEQYKIAFNLSAPLAALDSNAQQTAFQNTLDANLGVGTYAISSYETIGAQAAVVIVLGPPGQQALLQSKMAVLGADAAALVTDMGPVPAG
jgi:hypothetical protein